MPRRLIFLLLMIATTPLFAQETTTVPAIIPVPARMQTDTGFYRLPPIVRIQLPKGSSETVFIEKHIAEKWRLATGNLTSVVEGQPADIVLQINKPADKTIKTEGYLLKVDPKKGILIQANDAAGLFYGIQTFWQLLPPEIESKTPVASVIWKVPAVLIEDQPRFAWRGLMLDVVRHWFTLQQVKDFIDNMVKYKFNLLHLHLTDDQGWRIEIKGLPKLTEAGAFRAERTGRWGEFTAQQPGEPNNYGGFYTQNDIVELIAYAKERLVTILPEIDIPGHSMAFIAAYPELSCTPGNYQVNVGNRFMIWPGNGTFYGTIDNNLCPANEAVYAKLDIIFSEIATLFPFEYIHMGGDETYKGFWEKSEAVRALMKKEKLQNMHEVQSYFVKRVAKIISSKGKKMIGWDEILEGGLAPGAAVMSWQGEKGGIEAARQKHPVVMSPSTFAYVDLYQGDPLAEPPTYSMLRLKKSYEFNPVPTGVNPAYILGGQANLWSERLHTVRHAEYMLWPRGWAVAESVWSPLSQKNWNNFVSRVESHFSRSDMAGTNYARSLFDPVVEVKKTSEGTIEVYLSTEVEGLDIHYSFDEFPPDHFYPVYTAPLRFPAGASNLKLITYRKDQKVGKPINLPLAELTKRAK